RAGAGDDGRRAVQLDRPGPAAPGAQPPPAVAAGAVAGAPGRPGSAVRRGRAGHAGNEGGGRGQGRPPRPRRHRQRLPRRGPQGMTLWTDNLPYVESAIEHMEEGAPTALGDHLHWRLSDDPSVDDDSPERYVDAAEALTEHVVASAEVTDGRRILDVGCGFGGTLGHIRSRNQGCRLVGLNIDPRQLRWARRLLATGDDAGDGDVPPFVAADGCRLPVAGGSLDHVLAVECVFHFASRKAFFR